MNRYLAGSFLCLALASSQSFAGVPRPAEDAHGKLVREISDPEVRRVTERLLREKGLDYKKEAIRNLRENGAYFDHGRVEVTGFMSSDDTDASNPSIADKQIKPSFSVEGSSRRLANRMKWLRYDLDIPGIANALGADIGADFTEVTAAMRGETTARAKAKLAPYKNKEIEELAAHSWGTELIYAAILNGEILPPKKLIVTGVPDDDRWKWESLAMMTGTEVHWVRAPNDEVAQAGAKLAKLEAGNVDFLKKWEAACSARPKTCPAHGRKSELVIFEEIGDNPGLLGHDRMEYFDVLMQAEHPIMGTRDALRNAQDARIAAATHEAEQAALEEAFDKATGFVEAARAQAAAARADRLARLKTKIEDLAQRTCDYPGSVAQEEIDSLSPTLKEDFGEIASTYLVGSCAVNIFFSIGNGSGAEGIREEASRPPVVAVDVRAQPRVSPVVVATVTPEPPFSHAFPEMKDYAVRACQSPSQIRFERILIPYYDCSYEAYDDNLARELSSDMDDCSRRLFYRLIQNIRAVYWDQIDPRWVRKQVNSYLSTPPNAGGGYVPPSGGGGGGRSGGDSVVVPPPPPSHNAEGEALRQAQEIERRKRWGLRPVL